MSVAFLECTIEEARNLPSLNTSGKGIDSYVILWSSAAPKEEHKSKIHKKDNNPKFNETFGFIFESKLIQNNNLTNEINIQFRNFKAIGIQLVGNQLTIPFSLPEGEESSKWYQIPGISSGEVKVTLIWKKAKKTDIPEIIKTHTGGSTKSYYNSITRTQLKKRIREGDRGSDSEVQYLTVKVIESKHIPVGDIYFNAFLHSSQQITHKSTVKKSTANPKWDDEEFGFELVTIINDRVRDALRFEVKNSKSLTEKLTIGSLYIPLDNFKPQSQSAEWYKLEGAHNAELKISIARAPKKVADLPIQATNKSARASKKLLYALTIVRRKMAEFGLRATILISMKMAVVATRISVSIEPMSPEELALIDKEIQTVEGEVVQEDEEEQDAQDAEENKSLFKVMLSNAVQSLSNNLKGTLRDMRSMGLSGSVGSSVFLGLPMYGIEFEIGVDVELV